MVFPESGLWRCFGACNEGGDIFKFMMKKEGWDFPQALRALAERAGVTLTPLTPEKQAEDEEFERLHAVLEEAVTFYRYHMTSTPAGRAAQAYLEKRGLTPATIEAFGLGYAPDAWDSLLRHIVAKRHPRKTCSRRAWSASTNRAVLRSFPQPDHDPHPRRAGQDDRVWRAYPQPGRPAKISQLVPDSPV